MWYSLNVTRSGITHFLLRFIYLNVTSFLFYYFEERFPHYTLTHQTFTLTNVFLNLQFFSCVHSVTLFRSKLLTVLYMSHYVLQATVATEYLSQQPDIVICHARNRFYNVRQMALIEATLASYLPWNKPEA